MAQNAFTNEGYVSNVLAPFFSKLIARQWKLWQEVHLNLLKSDGRPLSPSDPCEAVLVDRIHLF